MRLLKILNPKNDITMSIIRLRILSEVGGGGGGFTVYCRRKMDLSDCVDNAITTINVRHGGEFFDIQGMDAMNQIGRYYVCQNRRYLATLSQPKPFLYLGGKKREFPTYLLVDNIADLKKTVHFELTWSDNVSM